MNVGVFYVVHTAIMLLKYYVQYLHQKLIHKLCKKKYSMMIDKVEYFLLFNSLIGIHIYMGLVMEVRLSC